MDRVMLYIRAIKINWNTRVNPAHHKFESDWIEIFLQISIWVDFFFDLVHLEPGSLGLNPW